MSFRTNNLVEDVLVLPARPAAPRYDVLAPRAARVIAVLRAAAAELRAAAAAGDTAAIAARSLLPRSHGAALVSIAKALAGKLARGSLHAPGVGGRRQSDREFDLGSLGPPLYDHAVEAMAEGNAGEAIAALCLVAASDNGRADGLLGLAVCAARLANYDTAWLLAIESLKHRPGHPRACCIAGLCGLERGDRKAAQHYLATAARMARRRPEFREDLRAAQRLLLMMHIA